MIFPRGNSTGAPLYSKHGFTGEKPLRIKVEAELEGVQSTIRFFQEYKAKLYGVWAKAMIAGAMVIHEESGRLVPIDTGHLWETSQVDYTGGGNRTEAFVRY